MDLLHWADSLSVSVPIASNASPKRLSFTAETLPAPSELSTDFLYVSPGMRSPGGTAISIEHLIFTADRRVYRALGLALFSYALSAQASPLRLQLSRTPGGVQQVVLWPSAESPLDRLLGIRRRVTEAHYRPVIPPDTPNYTTTEQDDERFPREHLPNVRLGSVEGVGIIQPDQAVCAHLVGTAPSLVWFGKYLLNLALEDNPATRGYLYNLNPAESLAFGSAELRFEVGVPAPPTA